MTQDVLRTIIHHNKAGNGGGIYSVCSAHPIVLEAAMKQAAQDGTSLLIEATSNQVDQFGGYTGMTPVDFREFVYGIADAHGFPRDRIILGGDHLGPNRWQGEDADTAMENARELIRAYAAAGYTKIHLDCSMSCAGDPVPLTDEIVADRAGQLLKIAEEVTAAEGRSEAVSYVIGTEVPVPGGAHETLSELVPTSPSAAQATVAAHKDAFARYGVDHLWPQVVALVVQPGVEFDHVKVVDYDPAKIGDLRTALASESTLAYEAHSTDYQTTEGLTNLVNDGWAILKVGPGLTFALREGLFALACIENQLIADEADRSNLEAVIEDTMLADPGYWKNYYEGTAQEQKIARKFSYSDRMRYYLPNERIVAAIDTLIANLNEVGIPEPLLSQYMPLQFERVRLGELDNEAHALLVDRVRDALRPYAAACAVPASATIV